MRPGRTGCRDHGQGTSSVALDTGVDDAGDLYPRRARDKFLQAAPIEIREYGGEFIMETDNTKESLIAELEKAIALR